MKGLFLVCLFLGIFWSGSVFAQVRITLSAVGDIHFGRPKSAMQNVKDPFRHVQHLWSGRDIVYANLETPVTTKPLRNVRFPKDCKLLECNRTEQTYHYWYQLTFWTRPANLRLLRRAGFTLMGTANNHVEDQGPEGLLETITHLKSANLLYSGTGSTKEEAWTPVVVEKQGVKVAFLAVTAIHNLPPSGKNAFFAVSPFPSILTELPEKVRQMKKTADFVVVALHYGKERDTRTTAEERQLVANLEKAGLDVFIGAHPHVLRGIQVINRMVAFYSMGNFLFLINAGDRVETGVAAVDFVKHGNERRLENIVFHPVRADGQPLGRMPRAVSGREAQNLLNRLMHYSRPLGNRPGELVIEGDQLHIRPSAFVPKVKAVDPPET